MTALLLVALVLWFAAALYGEQRWLDEQEGQTSRRASDGAK